MNLKKNFGKVHPSIGVDIEKKNRSLKGHSVFNASDQCLKTKIKHEEKFCVPARCFSSTGVSLDLYGTPKNTNVVEKFSRFYHARCDRRSQGTRTTKQNHVPPDRWFRSTRCKRRYVGGYPGTHPIIPILFGRRLAMFVSNVTPSVTIKNYHDD